MMTAKFLILFSFISCLVSGNRKEVSSSDCIDIFVKGYLVQKVKREEMESIQWNKRLKEQEKSYEQAIDYYEEIFFIPSDSLSETRNMSELLKENINFYNRQVFFLPSEDTKIKIKRFCEKGLTMDKFNDPFDTGQYFTIANDQENKYLYKFKYLEVRALHTKIENTFHNQIYFHLRYRIDKALEFFDAYFVYAITENMQKDPSDENLKAWIIEN